MTAAPHSPLLERARMAEAAGEYDIALAAYERLRRPADAARVAWRANRHADALRLFRDAGMRYEAAVCLCKLGHPDEALTEVQLTPREHANYPRAAQLAVRIASERGRVDLGLDLFLARYLDGTPSDELDLDAFDRAARLFESNGLGDQAREVLGRLASTAPSFRNARARFEKLDRTVAALPALDVARAQEDVDFQLRTSRRKTPASSLGVHELPVLPALPELPPLPAARTVATPPANQAHPVVAAAPANAQSAPPAMLELDALALPPGFVLAGRYAIEKKIGEGGMAAVYRARDRELDETVAIKTFQSEDPQLIARFRQEVALSRQLQHPNVIRLHDIGSHGRMKFLTMELLEGRCLDTCVGTALDVRYGVRLLLHVCAGLGAAHARGIVHRDIKPANFFLAHDGTLKLMDFGIAKRQGTNAGVTAAGFIAGTPHYMSPEQISNFAKATAVSDLYSVGVMAYEFFSGRVPFEHDDLVALLMMHVRDTPAPLRTVAPRCPPALETLVASLLAKDAAARPQSCDALAKQLVAVLKELPRPP